MKVADTSLPATASHMKKASLQIGLQRSKPILSQKGKMGIPLQSLMTHLPPHQRGTHSPISYYVWTEANARELATSQSGRSAERSE